ncbi:MAG: ferredoxin [Acidimicrobiia bacterium]
MSFRIVLDDSLCTGHGRCYALAPALFDSDDAGRSVLLAEVVDDEHRAAAEAAVANCPERAISLSEA